mmetsp:Transcript_227/g.274  ORF Transcript_227/g.274 Transcript_227/m.274 type:complete len:551 (-) Transcript_227:227-1879(-)
MSFGQFAATSQFYLYGRQYCTSLGYLSSMKKYFKGGKVPDLLEDPTLDMSGKVCMVTGANSGVGYEIAKYLALKGANVTMVCRSKSRGETALASIKNETKNEKVSLLLCDCSLETDVRRAWNEFANSEQNASESVPVKLDVLVCNAGVLLNDRTLTTEGIETTFACHLLFGTYLLTELAMSSLKTTPNSRVIVVSSGGMYNTKFPSFDIAASRDPSVNFDGNMAYAYQKRGQVLLCERWTSMHPEVKFMSTHPGWTATPAVKAAYSAEMIKYLEPMRDLWQGANGIVWLCVAPTEELQGGAFYLDRTVRTKHISGPFFSEGTYTKNSEEEVDEMMFKLEQYSNAATRPTPIDNDDMLRKRSEFEALKVPLTESSKPVDIQKFMGRWYVQATIPTYFEVGMMNSIEEYSWNETNQSIDVNFRMQSTPEAEPTQLLQRATITNKETNTRWAISPKIGIYLPLGLPYLLLDVNDDYSACLVGVPNRKNLWIMTREIGTPNTQSEPQESSVDALIKPLLEKAQVLGFDMSKVVSVKHDYSTDKSNSTDNCAAEK